MFREMRRFKQLLPQVDFLSLHCPLTEDTRHLINKDTIAKMKKGAYLINAARGPVVDSQALAEAFSVLRLGDRFAAVEVGAAGIGPGIGAQEQAVAGT